MGEPMRIRAQAGPAGAVVRVLVWHDMESGQRREGNRVVPAWHITEIAATHNGKPVFRSEWGPAVSRDPLLQFTIKGAKAGDRIQVTWKDSKGDSRTDEAVVA